MKRVLLLSAAIISISIANAQFLTRGKYKPFKVDLAVGGAFPQGPGAGGGVVFSLEPKYAILDQMVVGLRMEGAITARGFANSDGSAVSAKVAATASYAFTYDFYFTKLPFFRPFTGTGVGVFNMASASVDATSTSASTSIAAGSKVGGLVRAGFDFKHFRFVTEHNFIGRTEATYTDGTTTNTVVTKNGYTSIKIGFFFGGGKNH